MHLPPPMSVPMPPQEQAKGRESIMNFAVLVWGSIPTALIRGSMVMIPMAQAAASCMNEDEMPRLMAIIKVNLTTLFPAFFTMKYPSLLVRPALSNEMAKMRQHMMKDDHRMHIGRPSPFDIRYAHEHQKNTDADGGDFKWNGLNDEKYDQHRQHGQEPFCLG